jgi:DNA-binding MarR family transcriptional regulator
MTVVDARDEESDFLTFTDFAVAETSARLPEVDPEAMKLALLLHRVTNVIVYDFESTVHRPSGWSWSGFRLLFALWIAGPVESKRAAVISGMSRPAISALATTLEKDGLLERSSDPDDARSVVLSLTTHGQQQLEQAFMVHNKREQEWAGALSKRDRETLIRLLSKLARIAHQPWVNHR